MSTRRYARCQELRVCDSQGKINSGDRGSKEGDARTGTLFTRKYLRGVVCSTVAYVVVSASVRARVCGSVPPSPVGFLAYSSFTLFTKSSFTLFTKDT